MAARRNAKAAETVPDGSVAGLGARRAARDAVAALLGAARGIALDDALFEAARHPRLDPADTALARAIATATFRRMGYLRAVLAQRLDQGLPEGQPRLLALLATGAAQILDLNVADHAAVDLAVRLAKSDPQQRHRAGLVNAVLRRIAREAAAIGADLGDPLATNTPAWLAERWRATYGEDFARRIASAHLRGAAVDLTTTGDADALAVASGGARLRLGSVRLHDVRSAVAELPGYAEGSWWVQDAAAALPVRLLRPDSGERIVDLCAAPGGKTAQLAAVGAEVVAIDRSEARLERLQANLARLKLKAEIRACDALDLPEDQPFDAVLLDAPCSATGTIRRHPDVAWTKQPADIARLAAVQSRLLDKAARLVRPGGRLVYCSCSLEPEEGEAQAAAFLARHPDYLRLPVEEQELNGHAELIDGNGDLRTLPCHLDGEAASVRGGLDGFFASRFRRAG